MDSYILLIIVLLLVVGVSQWQCQGQDPSLVAARKEHKELMTALKQSTELNKELKQYLNQLKPIWEGVQNMCASISTRSCQCEAMKENQTKSVLTDSLHLSEGASLKVLSVQSGGRENNHTNVTVYYTAREGHTAQWIIRYGIYGVDGLFMAVGQVETLGQATYTTSLNLEYVDVIDYAKLKIYSGTEIITMTFDLAAIQMKGMQDLPEYKAELVDINASYVAPTSGDMNLTVTVDNSVINVSTISYISATLAWMNITEEESSEMYYDAFHNLNVSAQAGHLFGSGLHPKYNPFVPNEHSDVTHYANRTSTIITVEEALAQKGGMLQITLPWKPNTEHFYFIESIEYGMSVNIISPESTEVFPTNSVGMHNWHNVTLLRNIVPGPKQCLSCLAVGNPSPEVGIYVTHKNGSTEELRTDLKRPNSFTTVALFTLSAEDSRSPGNYTCRAQSGSAVIEDSTEVILYTPVTFDPARTDVARNTSKKLVVTCKVSGSVRPRLTFRLHEEFGEDAEVAGFKVMHTDVSKTTSLIKLVMSPPDPSVRSVVCVASTYYVEERRIIQLFPPEK